jgi:EmrB/QacA subfamily drug resistance transporter
VKKIIDPKWWVLFSIGTGSLMAALDGSVVNTILPVLRLYFQSDVASIQWVSTIYLIILSGLLLTFGHLGDIHGHKKLYLGGMVLFVLSSVICGGARSLPVLVTFRGVQAIGGAILASNAPAIVTGSFPSLQRGRAFGMVSTMTYLGLTLGPSLGGWLSQYFSWRMVFYINIPFGIVGFMLSLIFIPKDSPSSIKLPFDIWGACVFLLGLTTLMLWMNKGAELGWISPIIIGLLSLSIAFIIIFIIIERRIHYPMLDINIFRNSLFKNSVISALLNYISLFSVTFLLPFYLIQGRFLAPAQAGLLLSIQPIMMAIAAPLSGILSDRHGSRVLVMLGMAVMAAGLFMLSQIGEVTNLFYVGLALAVTGIGTGTFISPNTSALMGSAPKSHQGIAAGIQAAARNVGMVLGIGLSGAILTSNLATNAPISLFTGIDIGFLVSASVAVIGIFISAARERGH